MQHSDQYKTIQAPVQGMFKDKGSKFLAYLFPVQDEVACKKHLLELKKKHFDARHCCYAYRIGKEGILHRMNDDGEPSGTAGRPIHGQLVSAGLTQLLAVVVRYFGGTLLGTSGLIQAYKFATLDAIQQANILDCTWNSQIHCQLPYSQLNQMMKLIKEMPVEVMHQELSNACTFSLSIRESIEPELTNKLLKIEGIQIS